MSFHLSHHVYILAEDASEAGKYFEVSQQGLDADVCALSLLHQPRAAGLCSCLHSNSCSLLFSHAEITSRTTLDCAAGLGASLLTGLYLGGAVLLLLLFHGISLLCQAVRKPTFVAPGAQSLAKLDTELIFLRARLRCRTIIHIVLQGTQGMQQIMAEPADLPIKVDCESSCQDQEQ